MLKTLVMFSGSLRVSRQEEGVTSPLDVPLGSVQSQS